MPIKIFNRMRVLVWCGLMLWAMAAVAGPALAQPSDAVLHQLDTIEVLDLATAARIALASNPSLEAAQARVMQASQIVKQAQAPYWPQVDASAGAARVDMAENEFRSQQAIAQFFGSNLVNPEEYYNAGLAASWLVFDGFARKFRLAGARYGEQATAAARDDARRLLLSAVTFAYLQAQLAQENVAIAKADEAFNQRLLTESRLRYDVGTGALSDVLNFQIRGNSALSRRIQEETDYRRWLISLAALLGVPEGRFPEKLRLADMAPTTDQELAVPQSTEQVETALRLRPDLAARRLDRAPGRSRGQGRPGRLFPHGLAFGNL